MAGSEDKDHRRRSVRKASQSSFLISRNAKNEIREKVKRISEILKKPENLRSKADKAFVSKNPDIVKTSETNARRLKANKERVLEIEDEPAVLEAKCLQLAELIKSSKHVVVYTGAGISTAASIPDYRGPNGVWTMLRKGQELSPQDLSDAEPTLTHMSLTTLYRVGKVKHIVSQNVDGLHIRSGFPRHALSELHGNMYIECCYSCAPHKEFIRLFDVTERTGVHRHTTQRCCRACSGNLTDTIVHFGEKGKLKSPYRWKEAVRAAKKADLILCMGSSLKVLKKYACLWCMDKKPQLRPKLVIVNLQWTPKDDTATIKLNGKCDYVISKVMDLLQYDIPMYKREADPIFTLCTPLRAYELKTMSKKILDVPAQLTKSTSRQRKTKTTVTKQSRRKPPTNNSDVALLKRPPCDIQESAANSLTVLDARYKSDMFNLMSCNLSDQEKQPGPSESPDNKYPVMRNLLAPVSHFGSEKLAVLSSSMLNPICNTTSTQYSSFTECTSQDIYGKPLMCHPSLNTINLTQENLMNSQILISDRRTFGRNSSTHQLLDEGMPSKTEFQSANYASSSHTEFVSDGIYTGSGESTPCTLPNVVVIDLGKTEMVMGRDKSGTVGSGTGSCVSLITEKSVPSSPTGEESLAPHVAHQQEPATVKPPSVSQVSGHGFAGGLSNFQPGHFGGTIKVDLSELGNCSSYPKARTDLEATNRHFLSSGEGEILVCQQQEIFPGSSETGFRESVLGTGVQSPTIPPSKNFIEQSSIESIYNIYHDHCYFHQNLIKYELKSSLNDLTSLPVVQACDDRQCHLGSEMPPGLENVGSVTSDKQSFVSESSVASCDVPGVAPTEGVPSCILNMDDMEHLKLKASEHQAELLLSSKGCGYPDVHLPHVIILPVNPLLLISGTFLPKQLFVDHRTRLSKAESVLENAQLSRNSSGADVVKQRCDTKPSLFKCNPVIDLDTSCLSAFGSYLSGNSGIATGLSTSYVDLTLLSQEAVYTKDSMQVSLSGSLLIMDQGNKDSGNVPELSTQVVDHKISYVSSENNKPPISMHNKLLKVQSNKDIVFEDKLVNDPIATKQTVISNCAGNNLIGDVIKVDPKGRENVCISLNKRKHVVAAVPGWFGKGLGLKKKKK